MPVIIVYLSKLLYSPHLVLVAKRPVRSVNSAAYDALLDVLRAERERAGETPFSLSKAMGEGPMFVRKVEHRERRLDVVEFMDMAVALGVEPRELFDRWLSRVEAQRDGR